MTLLRIMMKASKLEVPKFLKLAQRARHIKTTDNKLASEQAFFNNNIIIINTKYLL